MVSYVYVQIQVYTLEMCIEQVCGLFLRKVMMNSLPLVSHVNEILLLIQQ